MSELEISAQSIPTSIRSSIAKAFSLPFPIFL
jgi:GntP family gluconate:H+ symporter